MTNNISKEAIARAQESAHNFMGIVRSIVEQGDKEHGQHIVPLLAQQVHELDTLVDTLATLLDKAANTNIAELGEIERLIYEARDKIKEARGE